jgi:hypothetical protein
MLKSLRLLALATALLALPALAQQVSNATPVQQTATRADACVPTSTTNAVNTVTTLTLTPPSGMFVYLCGLDINVSNNATGAVVSTNLIWTSTNFGGWQYKYSAVNTANTNGLDKTFSWNPVVRSAQPGLAMTIVSPAVNAQAAYTITAYYYFAY